jgi:hypothetical protein
MKVFILFLVGLLLLTGSNQSKGNNSEHTTELTHNPTAKEILIQYPDADIFLFEGISKTKRRLIFPSEYKFLSH